MQEDLIRKIAALMADQSAAYGRLESAASQLAGALTVGDPNKIESFARLGETELTRMRARLLEITSAMTGFAAMRAAQDEKIPLEAAARDEFESAAKGLVESARKFQRVSGRAGALAMNGQAFATACIQICGVPPTTYRAPVLRNGEGAAR